MERYSRVAGGPGRRRRDPWLALYQGRNTTLDRISTRPLLKQILAKLPATAVAGPDKVREGKPGRGAVLALDAAGRPVHYLGGPPSRVDTVSAAVRHHDVLYVSTLTGDAILRLRLPPEPPPRQPAARLTRVIGGAGTLGAQPLDPEE